MNLDDAIGTIISRGFTERQARFLVLVARHSGVCVMRQYSAFAGVVFGHTTRRFFTKLERLGWVSTYDCARKRARIYHVRHRELYEAVGDAESRLRRPPTVPRALERIMLLDAILREPDLVWLATSEEKMTHVSAFTTSWLRVGARRRGREGRSAQSMGSGPRAQVRGPPGRRQEQLWDP